MRIITDSASDITQEEAKKLNIDVIPLLVEFNGKSYQDGIDISKEEFYNKLIDYDDIPKTSMITSYRFSTYFEKYKDEEIIYIGLSKKLSNSFNQAILAKDDKENIHLIDSKNVAMGQRILVEYAVRLRDANKDVNYIINEVEK